MSSGANTPNISQPQPQSQQQPNDQKRKQTIVARDVKRFKGCSLFSEYNIIGKIGEGTFGYATQ